MLHSVKFSRRKLLITYKVTVIAMTVLIGYLLVQTILAGIASHAAGRAVQVVAGHERAAHWLGWASLGLVILIEVGVRIKGGSKHDAVFWAHSVFAALYAASLILLLFYYNGYRGAHHALVGYICAGSYVGLAAIGIPMTLTRF